MIVSIMSPRGDFLVLNENSKSESLTWGYRNHDELAYHYGKTYIEALYFCDDPQTLTFFYKEVLDYMEAKELDSKRTNAANGSNDSSPNRTSIPGWQRA